MKKFTVTKSLAAKVLEVVDAGLVCGLGTPQPGQMCVEAAVCFAMGLPHSDNPPCVGAAVRSFKIALNDSAWSSNEARAKGMRRLAIAQLGSESIDPNLFVKELTIATIKKIVPMALRAAAKVHPQAEHRAKLEQAAEKCAKDGTKESASEANTAASAAYAAASAAYAAADAAYAAAYAAYAVAYAADAVDSAYAAAYAARAAYAAARAAYAADAADAVDAAYAARAAYAAAYAARDEVLTAMAEAGVEALKTCGSPGCKFLHLTEAAE